MLPSRRSGESQTVTGCNLSKGPKTERCTGLHCDKDNDKRNENRGCEMKEVSELVKVNRERDSRLAVSELQQHEALNQDKICTVAMYNTID
jgi:hypothetical protein